VEELGEAFGIVRDHGVENVEEIVASIVPARQPFARRYLTEYIRYQLGADQWRGLRAYERLLVKHGWIGR
jgi:chorismate dehydratase